MRVLHRVNAAARLLTCRAAAPVSIGRQALFSSLTFALCIRMQRHPSFVRSVEAADATRGGGGAHELQVKVERASITSLSPATERSSPSWRENRTARCTTAVDGWYYAGSNIQLVPKYASAS
jgi:hypothetical protein